MKALTKTLIGVTLISVTMATQAHECECSPVETDEYGLDSSNVQNEPVYAAPRRKKTPSELAMSAPVKVAEAPDMGSPSINHQPDPTRFGSYREMAEDAEIQRLFQVWLGPGVVYVNRIGAWKRDIRKIRAHSYSGLSRNDFHGCSISYGGQSRFTRFAQGRDIRGGPQLQALNERGGRWVAWDEATPELQTKYESYCELFHQLAPHFIEMGLLEH